MILAIIFKRSGPLFQIIYNFTIYAKYPIAIYPYAIRFILIFILPFGLFISLPVDTLLYGTYNPYLLLLVHRSHSLRLLHLFGHYARDDTNQQHLN